MGLLALGRLIAPLTTAAACLPPGRRAAVKAQVALPVRRLCHTFAPACPATQGGEVEGSPHAAVSASLLSNRQVCGDGMKIMRRSHEEGPAVSPARMPCLCHRHSKTWFGPSPLQAPNSVGVAAGSMVGVADRMRRDRQGAPLTGWPRTGQSGAEGDGTVPHRPACRMSCLDRRGLSGVARRAPGGPPKAEPGADAGPAAPRGAALIRRHKDYSAENELRIEGPTRTSPARTAPDGATH